MRLALQALFGSHDNQTEEGRKRFERIERELRNNERSSNFLRRLNRVVADPRLKAPEIFADESFPDANIVAEYLDCQSESEEICAEYERVCIEEPEILAEVGCCYDMLMNRFDKQLDTPKIYKRRLYYIIWEEETAPESSLDEAIDVEASEPNSRKERKNKKNKQTAAPSRSSSKTIPSPPESEVQKAMRSEQSLGRWCYRFMRNTAVAAGLFVAVCWGYTRLNDDSSSETFVVPSVQKGIAHTEQAPIENPPEDASDSDGTVKEIVNDLNPTSSYVESGEFSGFLSDSFPQDLPNKNLMARIPTGEIAPTGGLGDNTVEPASETEPFSQNDFYRSQQPDESDLHAEGQENSPSRVELNAPDFNERREGIVIPVRNNDVFSNPARF